MNATTTAQTQSARIRDILSRIFQDYPGRLTIRIGENETLEFGSSDPGMTLIIKHPGVIRELVLSRDPVRLAEAYFQDKLDINGDIYQIEALRKYLTHSVYSLRTKLALLFAALRMPRPISPQDQAIRAPASHQNPSRTRSHNRSSIAFHYDVSDAFYRLWLDEQMVYSCAYFKSEQDNLHQAQCHKLDHICHKLQLRQGEQLLDIGCGWGAMILWAAKHYGVHAHGITLSRNQHRYVNQQIKQQGLQDQVTVALCDYRDLDAGICYDKIVSIGMFEHVGIKNLPVYFSAALHALKPNGLFLNHGITSDSEDWQANTGARMINRYVFPDGELETISRVQRVMEQCGLEILDVESMRRHYALTLRHWVSRLEAHHEDAIQQIPESVYRIWRLYMVGSALQFESGEIGIYQVLTRHKGQPATLQPWTRQGMCACAPRPMHS